MLRALLFASGFAFATAVAAPAVAAEPQPAMTVSRTTTPVSPATSSAGPASLRRLTTISLQLPVFDPRGRRVTTPNRAVTPGAFQVAFTPNLGAQVYSQQITVSPRTRVQLQVTTAPTIGFSRGRRCLRR